MSTGDHLVSISQVGENILRALAGFRYLTAQQMITLGIAKDKGHLHKVLLGLLSVKKKDGPAERRPKEIGELDFGVKVGKGRLPRLYYLTKRGAETLEEIDPALAPVGYPQRVTKFASDYEHRVRCIDFHILLHRWCVQNGHSLPWARWYFNWGEGSKGGRPQPVTRIPLKTGSIVPDGLFRIRDETGDERLFAFEMANGRGTGRVVQQIEHYCQAIDEEAINRACGYRHAIRVIFVFEHERQLELVAERSRRSTWLQAHAPHFFLKHVGQPYGVISQFPYGWRRLDDTGAPGPLF